MTWATLVFKGDVPSGKVAPLALESSLPLRTYFKAMRVEAAGDPPDDVWLYDVLVGGRSIVACGLARLAEFDRGCDVSWATCDPLAVRISVENLTGATQRVELRVGGLLLSPQAARQPTASSLSDAFRAAIAGSSFSREEVARCAGISDSVLRRFMNKKQGISLAAADRLAAVLGLTLVRVKP